MSYYDEASLVMIPSGYKTSKVYSIKPTDGSGDMAFTRSNDTATRVASNGLIERVRTNLVLQSQTFDNASWIKALGASVTANTTAAPDGTTTADTLTIADSQYLYQNIVLVAGNPYTISIYVKVASGTNQFKFNTFGSSNNFTSSAFTATTTWQRFSYTFTAVGSGSTAIYPLIVDGLAGGSFFIWGAQVETTDFGATHYIATTTAAVSVGPVANVPRLDYLNSSCPRLLLEPQRTNLVTYSEQFDNAAWAKNNTTISTNFATSPSGNQDADKIIPSTGNTDHNVDRAGVSVSSNGTASVFLKQSGYTKAAIRSYFTGGYASFDLVNGTILASAGVTAKIENYGNGWYRCSVNDTGNASYGYVIAVLDTSNDPTATYVGDGTSGVLAWGAQLEAGAYATSYIPTLGAAVTRGADAASKTSASALIGQTEGTIFWEFEFTTSVATANEALLNIDNGSFGTTFYISKSVAGGIVGEMYNGGVLQASFSLSSQPAGTYKAALGYANNNTAFFVNGVQVGTTDTSCSVPATNRIQLGNTALGPSTDKTAQLLLFPTRLSNADLAALTA